MKYEISDSSCYISVIDICVIFVSYLGENKNNILKLPDFLPSKHIVSRKNSERYTLLNIESVAYETALNKFSSSCNIKRMLI